jgi:flagellar assembly protein FliH
MFTAVKSVRFERGCYEIIGAGTALVRALPDQKKLELESEVVRLQIAIEDRDKQHRIDAQSAYEQGRIAGYEQGVADSRKAAEEAADLLRRLTGEIETQMAGVWERSREGALKLSLAIATRIIGSAAEAYRPLATELTRKCLTMMRDQAKATIFVNPDDAAQLRAVKSDLLTVAEGIRSLEIMERATVPRGGSVVETDAGQLDARLDEQLKVVESALLPDWSLPESEPSR